MRGARTAAISRWTVVVTVVLGVAILGGITYGIGQLTAPPPVDRAPVTLVDVGEVIVEPLPQMSSSTSPMSMPSLTSTMAAPVRGIASVRAAKGATVTLDGGITVPVPRGWKVVGTASSTGVALGTPGAMMNINVMRAEPGTLATEAAQDYLQNVVLPDVQGLKTTGAKAITVQSPSIASGGQIPYTSSLVTQQGSLPIWGVVAVFIRFDGTAVVFDFFEDEAVDVETQASAIIARTVRSL